MKLEVGMYVRTEDGDITKIKWISSQRWVGLENTVEAVLHLENNMILTFPDDNFKSSHNIIDLIEVGDYVNGWKIHWVDIKNQLLQVYDVKAGETLRLINKGSIKSIVTKEQFESMNYRIGSEE